MRDTRSQPAFTLIEVILAISIMAMLAAALMYTASGGPSSRYLDEGAIRFETLLRMARAESANRGRNLQMRFDTDGKYALFCEEKPLEEPGVYTEYSSSGWAADLPWDWVRVSYVERDRSDVYLPGGASAESDAGSSQKKDEAPGPLTFFPDGSSDSAVVELRSTEPSDHRSAVIQLDGVNGLFTTKVLTPSELEDYYVWLQQRGMTVRPGARQNGTTGNSTQRGGR